MSSQPAACPVVAINGAPAQCANRRRMLWLACALVAHASVVLAQGDTLSSKPAALPPQAPAHPAAPTTEKSKRRKLEVGFYLLYGVALMGGALLLWIIWWGLSLRRRIRAPLPPAPRGNELWFLKRPPGDNSLGLDQESPAEAPSPDRDQLTP
jgi:hypothetical protein